MLRDTCERDTLIVRSPCKHLHSHVPRTIAAKEMWRDVDVANQKKTQEQQEFLSLNRQTQKFLMFFRSVWWKRERARREPCEICANYTHIFIHLWVCHQTYVAYVCVLRAWVCVCAFDFALRYVSTFDTIRNHIVPHLTASARNRN